MLDWVYHKHITPTYIGGSVTIDKSLKLTVLRSTSSLDSVLMTPIMHDRLHQLRMFSFSYSLYFTLVTDIIASILNDRKRSIVRIRRAQSLVLAFRPVRANLNEKSGCGNRSKSSKYLRFSSIWTLFSSYTQNLDKDDPSRSEFHGPYSFGQNYTTTYCKRSHY